MIDAIRKELALATVEPRTTDVEQALLHAGFTREESLCTPRSSMYHVRLASREPLWVEYRPRDKTLQIHAPRSGKLALVHATPAGLSSVLKTCAALKEMDRHYA